ncbi:hypothetical protein CCH79_00011066 [Gambusia affinis]|uniref:Uncharacterized protein n=1 Tax=Gambusia affinis TaxID=33528 RepID=A0A315V6G8_GAMAF|nr:hypothetical protein CCH79_00011066 [Gambusia affinis]
MTRTPPRADKVCFFLSPTPKTPHTMRPLLLCSHALSWIFPQRCGHGFHRPFNKTPANIPMRHRPPTFNAPCVLKLLRCIRSLMRGEIPSSLMGLINHLSALEVYCWSGEVATREPTDTEHCCRSKPRHSGLSNEDGCILLSASHLVGPDYQLQRTSPWRSVSSQWKTWLVLVTVLLLMGLAPFVVHCLMTAFHDPSPPITFKVAAALFGFLTELLLAIASKN